jgi:hypothetical protein
MLRVERGGLVLHLDLGLGRRLDFRLLCHGGPLPGGRLASCPRAAGD